MPSRSSSSLSTDIDSSKTLAKRHHEAYVGLCQTGDSARSDRQIRFCRQGLKTRSARSAPEKLKHAGNMSEAATRNFQPSTDHQPTTIPCATRPPRIAARSKIFKPRPQKTSTRERRPSPEKLAPRMEMSRKNPQRRLHRESDARRRRRFWSVHAELLDHPLAQPERAVPLLHWPSHPGHGGRSTTMPRSPTTLSLANIDKPDTVTEIQWPSAAAQPQKRAPTLRTYLEKTTGARRSGYDPGAPSRASPSWPPQH